MKRLTFVLLIAVFAVVLAFSQSAGSTMYVAVKSTDMKSSTGIFAKKLGTLPLGATVTVVSASGKWVQVRSGSLAGWVALSGLSAKRVTGSGYSASAGEIALAGKGFSPETEIEYKKSGLDFSGVDQMEKIVIDPADLLQFIENGHLAKGE